MPPTPHLEPEHDPQQWTVRLQQVGGKLLLASRGDAGRRLATPLRQCVRELRGVWSALRQAALDFDPGALQGLQQRQRELGVVVEALGGAAARLSTSGASASARMSEELDDLDDLAASAGARLLADCLRASMGRVRRAAGEMRDEVGRSARDVQRSSLLLHNVDRELTAGYDRGPRDPLTRAASRHAFDQRVEQLAEQPSLIAGYWCVALVEIDNIETVNRKLGDRVGDALLFRVAGVLQDACDYHPGAMVARTGGKEFGVVLPRCPLRTGRRMAEHIRAAVGRARWQCKVGQPGGTLATTVSIGLVEYRDSESPDQLLARADACLEQARKAGRNALAADD